MEIVYHLPCTETHLSIRLGSGSGARRVWAEPCKKPFAGRRSHARRCNRHRAACGTCWSGMALLFAHTLVQQEY
jgi:hypothetical protein